MSDVPQIELENVDLHYGDFHALKDINLTIPKGTFVALVGPSGCGKSTLLRALAGLQNISDGTIKIAGEIMNKIPPRKRDVAMVFQSYALYPHMTVLENLTYSLRLRRVPKAEYVKAATEIAQTIGLTDLLTRYPRELSGGQRQRVAMGRAIIRDPKAFLFDEPLSNLDASLRVHMRKEIRSLHDRLGATTVYVTHDQIEAMTMADYVVVLHDGRIEQQGPPLELYDRPVNKFVAGFIGSPAMNFVAATIGKTGETATLDFAEPQTISLGRALEPGHKITISFRPEHMVIAATAPDLKLPVAFIEETGSTTYYTTATEPALTLVSQGRSAVGTGDFIGVKIAHEHIHIFDAETGKTL